MALPYAFSKAGWLAGGLCLSFMGMRSYFTMVHILNCVHATRIRLRRLQLESRLASSSDSPIGGYGSTATSKSTPTGLVINLPDGTPLPAGDADADPEFEIVGYQQIAACIWGFWGRKVVDFFLIFAQMGCGTAFLSLILSNIVAVLASYGTHVSLFTVACFVFPIVLGLSIPRSTTYLAGASHLGNMSLLLAVSTIVYFAATSDTSHVGEWTTTPSFIDLHGVLLFFGISAFSFTAHAEIVSVEADAESREKYAKILPLAMTTIVALYMSVSMFAAAAFREETRSNVLLNLGDALLVNIVRLALSATLLVNYALAVFPASQALDLVLIGPAPVSELPHQREPGDLMSPSPSPQPDEEGEVQPLIGGNHSLNIPTQVTLTAAGGMSRVSSSAGLSGAALESRNIHLSWYHAKGNLIRCGMVLFTFFIAVAVQNLGLLFSVVGAVFGGTLCYTLPPLFWFYLCRLEGIPMTFFRKCIVLGEVALGLALITVGVTVGIQSAAQQAEIEAQQHMTTQG